MMIRKQTLLAIIALVLLPQSAIAYLDPEAVLLNRELFMPPEAREAQERALLQSKESAARRQREQERAFSLQHPVVEEVVEEPLQAAAPAMPPGGFYAVPIQGFGQPLFGSAPNLQQAGLGDAANLELLRTMRLLSRVNQNQATSQLQQQILRSSADDLAPTGAGSVLAAMVLMGASIYTMRKARASGKAVRTI